MTDVLSQPEVEAEPQPAETPAPGGKRTRRGSFVVDLHNVLGLLAAVGIIVVSGTGIVLNHLDAFGLTRPVESTAERSPLDDALPIPNVVRIAQRADLRARGGDGEPAELDRAVWDLGKGTAEVRLDDQPIRTVWVEATTGDVLDRTTRNDLAVTQAHSGELIGSAFVVLSDVVGVAIITGVVSGVIIWLRRVKARRRLVGARPGTAWVRANWWFHLVGGLIASVYLVVVSVTGVLLNHKQPLGFMAKAPEVPKREAGFKPLPVAEMVESAIEFRGSGRFGIDDVKSVDYRPKGYAKVRFKDHDREVIVDAGDGSILKSSRRWDVWIEDLHSGVLFGRNGWLLSDIAGGIGILLAVNGAYLWVMPAWRARSRGQEPQ